jgi:hypothetical protein
VVPMLRLLPVIGELQICKLVLDFSELVSVLYSDPVSDPDSSSDCSLGCSLNWCISGLSLPRYGCSALLSYGSLYHLLSYRITVTGFSDESSPGTYNRILYPLLLTLCSVDISLTFEFAKAGVAS